MCALSYWPGDILGIFLSILVYVNCKLSLMKKSGEISFRIPAYRKSFTLLRSGWPKFLAALARGLMADKLTLPFQFVAKKPSLIGAKIAPPAKKQFYGFRVFPINLCRSVSTSKPDIPNGRGYRNPTKQSTVQLIFFYVGGNLYLIQFHNFFTPFPKWLLNNLSLHNHTGKAKNAAENGANDVQFVSLRSVTFPSFEQTCTWTNIYL